VVGGSGDPDSFTVHKTLTRALSGADRMKHITTLLALAPVAAFGQSLVSTQPENRTAFLEEFTGIHCGYCPEGHAISENLENMWKDRYVAINVHAGGYAVPAQGEPDFRTTDGTAIDAFFTVGGYPAGAVNRHVFNGADDLGRGAWEGACNEMLALSSPVNVGVESSYDAGTSTLTVHVVGYYTANSPAGNDRLSVAITESHIIGYQADYTNGTQANYDHKHVLRDIINTDTWGEDIGNPTAGELIERTYTYTVPAEWVVANCNVVAFIGEYQSDVYQAREVALDGGTTLIIGSFAGNGSPYRPGSNGNNTAFDGSFTNALGADAEYSVTLEAVDAPGTWTAYFEMNGIEYPNTATVNITNGNAQGINVVVQPDAAVGIGTYKLSIASTANPGAPVVEQEYSVISGVRDLVVTSPGAEAWEALYFDAMNYEPGRAKTTKQTFTNFGLANALGDVNNIYCNVSWTFPCLTDDMVQALQTFMDAGGNLMIAGQDIGWDNSGASGSYGTPVTQAFYADYLHAEFVADGSSTDNQANFEDGDAVFGTVPTSAIANVFNNNTYPEQITPIAPAVPILRYNNATKIGGLRAQTTNHKVVYFGVGPEQMANAAVGALMVSLSHDWFYGIVSVEEFDAALNNLGRPYPSPTADVVNIPVNGVEGDATLEVFDATGRVVLAQNLTGSRTLVTLNVEGLNNGLYSVRVRSNAGVGQAATFQVVR